LAHLVHTLAAGLAVLWAVASCLASAQRRGAYVWRAGVSGVLVDQSVAVIVEAVAAFDGSRVDCGKPVGAVPVNCGDEGYGRLAHALAAAVCSKAVQVRVEIVRPAAGRIDFIGLAIAIVIDAVAYFGSCRGAFAELVACDATGFPFASAIRVVKVAVPAVQAVIGLPIAVVVHAVALFGRWCRGRAGLVARALGLAGSVDVAQRTDGQVFLDPEPVGALADA
jgi:hypothetical protein